MKRSASTMSAANSTFEETVALLTAANEVVQDPAIAGTALRTIALRIRGAKIELEEMGESTEGMADSTAKLREQIKALTNVDGTGGFDIMIDDRNFKSIFQIMKGISQVYDRMNDIDRTALIELIAGEQTCLEFVETHIHRTYLIARAA